VAGWSDRARSIAAVIVSGGVLLAGCADRSGYREVLPNGSAASAPTDTFSVHVDEIADIGLPTLRNISDQPVRLSSIQLLGQPPAVHVLNIRAYDMNQVGYGSIIAAFGDLHAECPTQFVPHPIGSFVLAPRRYSRFFLVLAFTVSRPGVYRLGRIKVSYTSDGAAGWQYQTTFQYAVRVINPPRPGLRPMPKSEICVKP
jgi:hypothetical protein